MCGSLGQNSRNQEPPPALCAMLHGMDNLADNKGLSRVEVVCVVGIACFAVALLAVLGWYLLSLMWQRQRRERAQHRSGRRERQRCRASAWCPVVPARTTLPTPPMSQPTAPTSPTIKRARTRWWPIRRPATTRATRSSSTARTSTSSATRASSKSSEQREASRRDGFSPPSPRASARSGRTFLRSVRFRLCSWVCSPPEATAGLSHMSSKNSPQRYAETLHDLVERVVEPEVSGFPCSMSAR